MQQFIDLTKIAKKTKISRHAVPRYFEILEDTLIGYRIHPFSPLVEAQDLIRHPKFYLFDNGVYNGMLGNFVPSQDRLGVLAEQTVFSQLLHSASAREQDINISSFRTRRGLEVDFIVQLARRTLAIEVKNNDSLSADDCDGLLFFKKSLSKPAHLLYFSYGTKRTTYWSSMGPAMAAGAARSRPIVSAAPAVTPLTVCVDGIG